MCRKPTEDFCMCNFQVTNVSAVDIGIANKDKTDK